MLRFLTLKEVDISKETLQILKKKDIEADKEEIKKLISDELKKAWIPEKDRLRYLENVTNEQIKYSIEYGEILISV